MRNVVLQAALNASGAEIDPHHLPPDIATQSPYRNATTPDQLPVTDLEELEKQAITRALARSRGHQGVVAEQLGISRRTLSRKLKQYRIERRSEAGSELGCAQVFRASITTQVSIASRHGQQTATTVNVSEGGIAVEGIRDPHQLTGVLTIQFMIPGESGAVIARAQVEWADPQGHAGFRFIQIDKASRATLDEWLQRERSQVAAESTTR